MYFETSALNALAQGRTAADAEAIRALCRLRGTLLFLSPVVLWELSQTADQERREHLIQFSQRLFEETLLPSPEELIVRYIRSGCPVVQSPFPLVSTEPIAQVWADISANKDKTLAVNPEDVRIRTRIVADRCRLLRAGLIQRDLKAPFTAAAQMDVQLQILIEGLNFVRKDRPDRATLDIYKIAAFWVLHILCAEVSLDSGPITEFWSAVGLGTVYERLMYVTSNLPTLIHRGPFVEMALMTRQQQRRRFSRGEYFDCLHSVYLPYVDWLVTNDNHFNVLRGAIRHPNYGKIAMIGEVLRGAARAGP